MYLHRTWRLPRPICSTAAAGYGCSVTAMRLKSADVAANSAALQARLQAGDWDTAIGGEHTVKRSLGEWRQRLRELPAGTKLAIDYRRDGKPGSTELVLADRIPATSASGSKH